MIATVAYVERKFEEFNQLMFAGQLPKIPICLSNAKTFLGQCVCRKRINADGTTDYYDFRLRINTRIDLPEHEVEDTIIHEMIHYFIMLNHLKDTSSHGTVFKHMMNTINAKYGRHVSIRHRGTADQNEQAIDKRQHWHVVAIVHFNDGRTGLKVLPRVMSSIINYYNTVSKARHVTAIDLFLTNNIYFNRYPNSSALKVHYADKDELRAHLTDAKTLTISGHKVLVHNK